MEEIHWIFKLSPNIFGIVIGWIAVYFMRSYKEYNADNLTKTVAVFIGGVGLCSLPFFTGTIVGNISVLYYILGCALGCIFHFIYQFIISLCFKNKFCRVYDEYTLLSSCNISEDEMSNIRNNGVNATRLEKSYNLLNKGIINEDDFIMYIKECPITKTEYDKISQTDTDYILLSDDAIAYITAKGLRKYFKD